MDIPVGDEQPPASPDGLQASSILQRLSKLRLSSAPRAANPPISLTSPERISSASPKTILYLAYGSNLSSETFRGNRGIRPLSAINVQVPSLDLTFDLSGIPYLEPCFANTQYRHASSPSVSPEDYHKDRWKKGLVGVVYEVTPADYRTIIATEGGGASYQDVVVDCHPLLRGSKTVDAHPTGPSFQAHTLLSPRDGSSSSSNSVSRPDPSYAQSSARYLKLITDGGEEHALPDEYMAYLHGIRPYTITQWRQQVGKVLFVGFWMPIIMALFGLGRVFAGKDGKIPSWLAKAMAIVFSLMWKTYDVGFKKNFGDGERTMKEKATGGMGFMKRAYSERWSEKSIRLEGTS